MSTLNTKDIYVFVTQTVCVIDIGCWYGYNRSMRNLTDDNRKSIYLQFGRQVREIREKAGLTQEELAVAISMTRTSITNIEKGRQKILLHTLYDIAMALNVDIRDLLPEQSQHEDIYHQIPKDLTDEEQDWIKSIVIDEEVGS